MGNNNVYGQGNFITPNKIIKTKNKIDQNCINIENVFGRIQMDSARAERGNDTEFNNNIDVSVDRQIIYYQKQMQIGTVQESRQKQKQIQKQKQNQRQRYSKSSIPIAVPLTNRQNIQSDTKQLQTYTITQRKIKSTIHINKYQGRTSSSLQIEMDKYMSKKNSPIRHQNMHSEGSQVQVFSSRVVKSYFNNTS